MVRLVTLEQLAADPHWTEVPSAVLEALLWEADAEKRTLAVLMLATRRFQQAGESAALDFLLQSRARLRCYPLPVIHNIVWLCGRLHREQIAAHACLKFARDAFRMQYFDLGLEAASAALILDAQAEYEITRHPALGAEVAAFYEQAAASLPVRLGAEATARRPGPLRLALVTPNLVDHVVAYTRTLLSLVRHADPNACRMKVYVSENHALRTAPLFPCGCIEFCTEERGRLALDELRAAGVRVYLGPRHLRCREAAQHLARQLEQDETDAVLLLSGLSAPIDWLAVRTARVPVKTAIHIGSSLFMPEFDATFYDNPVNIERENDYWPPGGGERIVVRTGVEVKILDAQPAFSRERFGLPADAVVIGVLSNHLERRLSEPYLAVIAEALQKHPQAWFLAFGSDDLPEKRAFFARHGVDARVRFGGKQSQSGSALKVMDLYANEYPVGGSTSVLEAMACGLPVLAMKWSLVHAESAGAEWVGEPIAIPGPDLAAYAHRLDQWLRDPALRRHIGHTLRQRVLQSFTMEQYVGNLLQDLSRRVNARQPAEKCS